MPKVEVFKDEKALQQAVCSYIADIIRRKKSAITTIGLSGGSAIRVLSNGLPKETCDWSNCCFLFCDERIVDFDDDESTYGSYAPLFKTLKVKDENIVKINPTLPLDKCAADYEQKINDLLCKIDSRFDLLILGMGPDGHTASLFPNHLALSICDKSVALITDSPKPPKDRVTLTLPIINNSENVCFICMGKNKAEVLHQIMDLGHESYPAALVKPKSGKLTWFLDEDAASKLAHPWSH